MKSTRDVVYENTVGCGESIGLAWLGLLEIEVWFSL